MDGPTIQSWCSFIPPSFLWDLANDGTLNAELREVARANIDTGHVLLSKLESSKLPDSFERLKVFPPLRTTASGGLEFMDRTAARVVIFNAGRKDSFEEDTPPAHETYEDNSRRRSLEHRLESVFHFFESVFGYKLFEDRQCTIGVLMNYGNNYMNAHWSGYRVILGGGNPSFLQGFDEADDIIVHELTHGIIMRTSGLKNTKETGALNEHLADVLGILYKQWKQRDILTSEEPVVVTAKTERGLDGLWRIGDTLWGQPDGLVYGRPRPEMERFLGRSFPGTPSPHNPFTPYDPNTPESMTFRARRRYFRSFADPRNATPPQPAHWHSFKFFDINLDNGGVHTNSGIPNHAFFIAAMDADSPSWEGVGQVWFRAMTDPGLGVDCTFSRFAAITIAYAEIYDLRLKLSIVKGWAAVGVSPDTGIALSPYATTQPPPASPLALTTGQRSGPSGTEQTSWLSDVLDPLYMERKFVDAGYKTYDLGVPSPWTNPAGPGQSSSEPTITKSP